jgi:AhpD family alkylhydroperoxidase
MAGAETLNKKERQLVYLSASIASGCQPCTKFHTRKSPEAGLTDVEVNKTLAFAISIRNNATNSMKSIIHNHKKVDKIIMDEQDSMNRNDALVGIAAAYSINFPKGLEKYISIARTNGINDKELCEIIKISKSVIDMARAHVDIITDRIGIIQPSENKDDCCCPSKK